MDYEQAPHVVNLDMPTDQQIQILLCAASFPSLATVHILERKMR
jgi:hypothetical protein